MKLLYENASPASSFSAQTIPIDLTDYSDIVITVFACDALCPATFLIPVGFNGELVATRDAISMRSIVVEENGVTFGTGYWMSGYHGSFDRSDNRSLHPYRIYGLKGIIVAE